MGGASPEPSAGEGPNAIGSDSLATKGTAEGMAGRISIPVAGNIEEHKKMVMRLVSDTGFDAFDAGTVEESWRQQPGAPCYCTDLTYDEMKSVIAATEKHGCLRVGILLSMQFRSEWAISNPIRLLIILFDYTGLFYVIRKPYFIYRCMSENAKDLLIAHEGQSYLNLQHCRRFEYEYVTVEQRVLSRDYRGGSSSSLKFLMSR